MSGEPRGFWARGDRWVAHAGSIATVALAGDDAAGRFDAVRRRAAAALEDVSNAERGDSKRYSGLRWFGGFSFRDDHQPRRHWEAFPAAHFILPRVELEGDADGIVRLRMRRLANDDQLVDDVSRELESELDDFAARLSDREGIPRSAECRLTATDSERGGWEHAVAEALERIGRGTLSKAVLARTMDVTTDTPLDPVDVVRELRLENRGSHVFLYEPRPGSSLVGAAPETIATLRRGVFQATAVAGSIRRGATMAETDELARSLLASEKDRAEQRIVVDDMVARIEALTHDLEVQESPHVLRLARIQHLETEIRARLNGAGDVLSMIEALHPTPAVCGVPRDDALAFLQHEEPFERGWYAGPVGWFDCKGNGVFAPALRCAVNQRDGWRLFAGAGIVAGSQPAAEWDETRIKFEPVLRALAQVAGSDVVFSDVRAQREAEAPR